LQIYFLRFWGFLYNGLSNFWMFCMSTSLHDLVNVPGLQFFHSLTQDPTLAKIVYFFADGPIFLLPIFLLGIWIYAAVKKNTDIKIRLLFVFYSCVWAFLGNSFVQLFFHFPRPEASLDASKGLILSHIPDDSFPSDHASVGMAFLASLYFFGWKKEALILSPFFFLMFLSRIAGGVHWPLDIVVGIGIGILASFTLYKCQKICMMQKINAFLLKIASLLKL